MEKIGIEASWIVQGFIYMLVVITGFLSVFHLKRIDQSHSDLKIKDDEFDKAIKEILLKLVENTQRMKNIDNEILHVRKSCEINEKVLEQNLLRVQKELDKLSESVERFKITIMSK